MRHLFLAAALLVSPSLAAAQTNCQQASSNRVIGTVAGGGIGAVLGNIIAGSSDKTLGTVIGAGAGALLGNQITKPGQDCANAYGFYDKAGAWHSNDLRGGNATGYFNRDSQWVEGTPRGYYDSNNRWIAVDADTAQSGYRNERGNWVPVSAEGYYDADNQFRTGTASGYYNNGHWIAGPTVGRYDANGRWISGAAAGRRDASGQWVADAQPGYYDRSGRWIAGQTRGFYDARGNWMPVGGYGQRGSANDQRYDDNRNNGYNQRDGMVAGYYNSGRWIAGPTTGQYDANGRWIAGAPAGRRDANGNWVFDAQPGYYDNYGRWQRGTVRGSYDNQGRWIDAGNGYGQNAIVPTAERLNRIEQRIDRGVRDRSLSQAEARGALNEVASIRLFDRRKRTRNGTISTRNAALVDARIDRLSQRVRLERNDNNGYDARTGG